ncbi:MAG: efflux RND transporter periplasmic adaptor subunit [Gammaproteobacteria bacterium]|nr:efflux RND transporter periplasmic adaptor subunit [Gammaproteobacteria bacterium]
MLKRIQKLQLQPRQKKAFIGILTAIGILYGIHLFHTYRVSHAAPVVPAVTVEVETVQLGAMPIEVHAVGALIAAHHVDVTPEIAGHVAEVYYPDGGVPVQTGAVLLKLDDLSAKAKLDQAEAGLAYSSADYERKQSLGKRGAISKQAIDQALEDLKIKRAMRDEAAADLAHTKLLAPFSGVLGKVNVSPGDYVTVGQKIVSLTDISHLRAEYEIPEKYLSQLKMGQTVRVSTATWSDKIFTGVVTFVAPTVNPDNRTISLYADIPNDQHLLTAGLFVDVVQVLGTESHALIVPPSSLVSVMDGQKVFRVINSNKVESVPVTVVRRSQGAVEVSGSLTPGDRIVVAGQQKLVDGTTVQWQNNRSSS